MIFDHAIGNEARAGKSGKALFFELASEDSTQAAELFRPIHSATDANVRLHVDRGRQTENK